MSDEQLSLSALNEMDGEAFVEVCGGFFESSPWIAERAWERGPFTALAELHAAMTAVVQEVAAADKIALIRAHPDLVGKMAQQGRLTTASTQEQRAAGLSDLSQQEIELFERNNAAYKERFGFPFVICARENKKERILEAFPRRLQNDREQEIDTAIREVSRIAWLRMTDRIREE